MYRKETHIMTQNKMVLPGIQRQKKKERAGKKPERKDCGNEVDIGDLSCIILIYKSEMG
jgi:hypothetical protein